MKYRHATLDDVSQLRNLEQKLIEAERLYNRLIRESGVRYYDIEALISDHNSILLVAETSNNVIATGYAKIRPSKQSLSHEFDGYLGFMYVTKDFRGRGVNKEIIDRLIAWNREQGVNDIYLDVYADNAPAINAYLKAGFHPSMIEMKLSF